MDKTSIAKLTFYAALSIMLVGILKLIGGGHSAWLFAIIVGLIATFGARNAYSLYRLPAQEQSGLLAAGMQHDMQHDDYRARDLHEFLSETGSYISYRDDE